MERKVIQTSVMGNTLIAVCDDGTMWRAYIGMDSELPVWHQLPPIPQPEKLNKPTDFETCTIIINGQPFLRRISTRITYDELCSLAKKRADVTPTITFNYHKNRNRRDGSLLPYEAINVEDGMIFNVVYTNNA